MKKKKLTTMQENFAREWALCGNKSEAYRRAYNAENMKPDTVAQKACSTSKLDHVRARFEEYQRDTADLCCITKAKQLLEIAQLAYCNPDGLTVKAADKIRALESINKMLGYNEPDKIDHTTKGDKVAPAGPPVINFVHAEDVDLDEYVAKLEQEEQELRDM